MTPGAAARAVLLVQQLDVDALVNLLAAYGMAWTLVGDRQAIPGSFWGDAEAGLVGNRLLARCDTPVHSVLHEAGHYICMAPERRVRLHTNAGGDYAEENAVCYLQILLADYLPGVGRERLMADMDAWGYSFRLGSAKTWFQHDAEDARLWLLKRGLIDAACRPTWLLRDGSSV
jgi:hypothetical protein